MVFVRPAVPEDADDLAPRLRPADLREIRAVTRQSPRDVLAGGIVASDPCHAVCTDAGVCVALFGVVPDRRPGCGAVWLLGSEELVREPLLFLRSSRAWVDRLAERYETLKVVIDARNEVHLRWLSYCGFSHRRTLENHGIERRRFHELGRGRAPAERA